MAFKIILFFTLFVTIHSVQFEVGEDKGWIVPKSKKERAFNGWASKQRFKVGDTLEFKYKKDSVLVVTEEEYAKCGSARPIFFSNNGHTKYKFDHPGLYYFISGIADHCDRGLKMIVKVLDQDIVSSSGSKDKNGAVAVQNDNGIMVLQFVILSLFGYAFA